MQRYIVDLHLHGRRFFETIRNFGIGARQYQDPNELYAKQHQLYQECASQIGVALNSVPELFYKELQTLPNPVYFEHLDDFNDNPQLVQSFVDAFREFAIGLYLQVGEKVGYKYHCDYLLEASTPDYIVIMETMKYQQEV